MQSVFEYLLGGDKLRIPLMKKGIMHDHCRCGKFGNAWFLSLGDVEKFHFSNLEDWKRTYIIDDGRWRSDVRG